MHISKPWWDGDLLIVNAINSTAGLFAGDEIDNNIEVRTGSQLLVTSPSASRVHRMRTGMASVRQSIRVERGGWLEMWPALFIAHGGSDYLQETSVDLDDDAHFLWFETFAPGRIAYGEAWEFTRFESRFRLCCNSRPIVRETYSLTPESARGLRRQFPFACHGTCYAAGGEFSGDVLEAISTLHQSECWVGCTRLDGEAIAVRVVAADNLLLSKALAKVRELVHGSFGRVVPSLRRT
jgi:urease accessory protein